MFGMPGGRTSESQQIRRARKTVEKMIALYCHDCHAPAHGLCDACRELAEYANGRLDRCAFRGDKPPCLQCPVHCYRESMRKRITEVMRYAGPRMIRRHPLLAIRHVVDSRQRRSRASRP